MSKVITPGYIRSLRLNENKRYLVLVVNKNSGTTGVDTVEPARELLPAKLISQHGYIFLFECTNKRNIKKRVCINKIDYLINKKLITEIK